jgi:hypothetical protein
MSQQEKEDVEEKHHQEEKEDQFSVLPKSKKKRAVKRNEQERTAELSPSAQYATSGVGSSSQKYQVVGKVELSIIDKVVGY